MSRPAPTLMKRSHMQAAAIFEALLDVPCALPNISSLMFRKQPNRCRHTGLCLWRRKREKHEVMWAVLVENHVFTENVWNVATVETPKAFDSVDFLGCVKHPCVLPCLAKSQSCFQYFEWVDCCLWHTTSTRSGNEALKYWHRTILWAANEALYLFVCSKLYCGLWSDL